MKKILFIVAIASMFGGLAKAQDTLYRDTPLSNYYCTYWPDTTSESFSFVRYEFAYGKITAKQNVTEDTLTVYGIAVSMITPFYNEFPCFPTPEWWKDTAQYLLDHYRRDTSTKHTEESLLLYQYDGAASSRMRLLGDSLPVHAIDTPVSYYLQTDIFAGHYHGDSCYEGALPVYERYFAVPQIVHDTFYTGFTQNCFGITFNDDSTDWGWSWLHPEVDVPAFSSTTPPPVQNYVAVYRQYTPWDSPSWEYRTTSHGLVYFIFPILTPKPEDPVAVSGVMEIDRHVSLSPNPTKERVEVVSNLGMSSIEVYDGGGRKVHEHQVSGYKAVLDVRGWASGTYLLRVTTPMGTTTKKLLVR